MGNIKHNDELLRVHDDGFDVVFNCDNKHQNGVSYHAEKNGKKTKIDPEYAMAALVKKVSGAGWPADMPVPSAGGYGYTEQESRVAFEGNTDPSGGWEYEMESSEPVLEVGKTYTVVIDDDEYANLTAAADEWGGVVIGDRSYADYPFMISAYPYAIYIYLDPSIYARGTTYSIKIESTEETIHMIDSKYLPASGGGALVVDFTLDEQTGTLTGTKTVAEVTAAMKEGVVVATFSTTNSLAPVTKQPLGAAYWLEAGDTLTPGPFWGTIVASSGVSISPVIGVSNGNWSMA